MNNVIHKFDYNVDRKLLLSELPVTNRFSSLNPEWKRSFELGTYGKKIENSFIKLVKGKASAGYYFQSKEISILEHLDTGCKCCININLTNDTTPIIINNTEIVYSCALINVSSYRHSVPKPKIDRIIFRIVFLEESFEKIKILCTSSKMGNVQIRG